MISIFTTTTAIAINFFISSGVADSQMDGALVSGVKRDFRSQITIFRAQRRLEPKIKLVKYVILFVHFFVELYFQLYGVTFYCL